MHIVRIGDLAFELDIIVVRLLNDNDNAMTK